MGKVRASISVLLAFATAVPSIAQQAAPPARPQRPERPAASSPPDKKTQADAILERAYAADEAGRYAEAVRLYDRAYALTPDTGILLVRGSAKSRMNDCAGALADFAIVEDELVFSNFIADTGLYVDRAYCNMALKDYEAVTEDLYNQVTQNPDDVWSWITLGRAYSLTDLPGLAEEAFKKAIELAPDNPDTHYWLGLQYVLDKRPREALPHLQAAARLAPDKAEIREMLQSTEQALAQSSAPPQPSMPPPAAAVRPSPAAGSGRPTGASARTPAAPISYPPIDPRSDLGRGIALYLDGDFQPAIRLLTEATQAAPNDARGFAFLGATYYKLGMQRESDAARDRALALDPAVLKMVP